MSATKMHTDAGSNDQENLTHKRPWLFRKAQFFLILAAVLSIIFLSYCGIGFTRLLVAKQDRVKSMLLWNNFFSESYDRIFTTGEDEKLIFCPEKCLISRNRADPLNHDVLVFHTRNPQNPPHVRRNDQIYIAWTWESPTSRGNYYMKGDFYNWTATYHRKSTVPLLHGVLHKTPARVTMPQLPQFRGTGSVGHEGKNSSIIAWIVSNCSPLSRRQEYVAAMKLHMGVDTFGACGHKCPAGKRANDESCYHHIAATGKYKFYLAFENSFCEDYITLKPFRALSVGMVPIVMGGLTKEEYFDILPKGSYIDVRDFVTVKKLTDYLRELDKDKKKYLKYHAWRTSYRVGYDQIFGTFTCQICKALHDRKHRDKVETVNFGVFWNPVKMCQNLIEKMLSLERKVSPPLI